MKIPEDVILEIKYRNPIEDVVAPYVDLKRSGRNLKGLCPFHSEKTPSFTVYPESNSYYCFGCGAGGDVVTFVKSIENLDYIEALRLLADRSGVSLPEDGYDDSIFKLKSRLYEINREAGRYFYDYMFTPDGRWAYDYLEGRGLSKKTITHFGLGAAPDRWDGLLKHLKARGYGISEMEQAGVIVKGTKGYYDRFRNKVMFPIIDLQKRVIGFSGRARPGDEKKGGKYINTSDTLIYKKSNHLYGMNFAKANCSERLVLVEGNMDVISLHQAGVENAVAALGTSFTEEQARLMARYTGEVVLVMDSDAAGRKATDRALAILNKTGLAARVVSVPDGKDPDEYVKKNGGEKFKALLAGASSDIDYMLFKASEGLDLDKNADRLAFLNGAAEILARVDDSVAVDMYSGRLADKYGVAKSTMLQKISELRGKNRRRVKKEQIKNIISPKINREHPNLEKFKYPRAAASEETILGILIKHPDSFLDLSLSEDDFVTPLCRRIFISIKELYGRGSDFDIAFLADSFTERETGYITSLTLDREFGKDYKKLLNDAVDVLKEEKLKISASSAGSMGEDDWTEMMQNLIEKKVKKDG